jgi:sodium-dependent phosphate cotransporter
VEAIGFEKTLKVITRPFIGLSDAYVPYPFNLLVVAIFLLFSLKLIVNAMRVLVLNRMTNIMDKVLFKDPITAFTVGLLFTVVVQSSSVTTSFVIPFITANVLTLSQIFPYIFGANIGTTVTCIMAALIS